MDEQIIQQTKIISREIVEKEFPKEEEYFDFLFDLTIQEIRELERGKEAEFLRQMRAAHPELVLGFTPIIIILTVQILTEATHHRITKDIIKKRIAAILKDENERKRLSGISKYLTDI